MNHLVSNRTSDSTRRGFTLIEMLVATAIMILMSGAGIAAFINFNDKQTLVANAKELQAYLRTAQGRVRAGDKPTGCDTLNGYAVRLAVSSPTVNLYAVCDSGDILRSSYTLDSGISVTSPLNVTFLGLHGGVRGSGTVTLESTNDLQYEFEITAGGEITEGGVVDPAQ